MLEYSCACRCSNIPAPQGAVMRRRNKRSCKITALAIRRALQRCQCQHRSRVPAQHCYQCPRFTSTLRHRLPPLMQHARATLIPACFWILRWPAKGCYIPDAQLTIMRSGHCQPTASRTCDDATHSSAMVSDGLRFAHRKRHGNTMIDTTAHRAATSHRTSPRVVNVSAQRNTQDCVRVHKVRCALHLNRRIGRTAAVILFCGRVISRVLWHRLLRSCSAGTGRCCAQGPLILAATLPPGTKATAAQCSLCGAGSTCKSSFCCSSSKWLRGHGTCEAEHGGARQASVHCCRRAEAAALRMSPRGWQPEATGRMIYLRGDRRPFT